MLIETYMRIEFAGNGSKSKSSLDTAAMAASQKQAGHSGNGSKSEAGRSQRQWQQVETIGAILAGISA